MIAVDPPEATTADAQQRASDVLLLAHAHSPAIPVRVRVRVPARLTAQPIAVGSPTGGMSAITRSTGRPDPDDQYPRSLNSNSSDEAVSFIARHACTSMS